jgi:acyl-CoA thioester hydrolase
VTRAAEPLAGFHMEIPVRFSECDLYGVVWHGRYAIYLEEIRNAICVRYGWTVDRARQEGYLIPVTRLEIEFRAPARVDTRLQVTARLRPPDVARFAMDYEIREGNGTLLTRAATEQVVTRLDGELLVSLPAFLRTLAQSILRGQDDPRERELGPRGGPAPES